MIDIKDIFSYFPYVLLAGFFLLIIALLKPSKIFVKQLLELELPAFGTKRSLILGVVGCFLIIIGLGGVWASCQVTNLPPDINTILRIPDSPITASKNGTLVTIHVKTVDLNDPYINQKANNSIQRMIYCPPQFQYNILVKRPGRNFYDLIESQDTKERSCNCTWWVFPSDAGVNQILINIAIKDKNAESTNWSGEYFIRAT